MTSIPRHEFDSARRWREAHNLTPQQLSDLVGWSPTAIWFFENGTTPGPKKKQHDRSLKYSVWLRYRQACAGVDAQIRQKRDFNWGK